MRYTEVTKIPSIAIKQGSVTKGVCITIAIPTYKRSHLLKETLESCLAQKTTTPFAIMVVDNNPERDCKTEQLIKNYTAPNLSYYKNTQNIGIVGNWNKLFELAQTDFVVMLHDDDKLNEDYTKKLDKVLNHNKKWRVTMKKSVLAALVLGASLAVTGCFDKQETAQKVEAAKDATANAATQIKDAAKEVATDVKNAAIDAKDSAANKMAETKEAVVDKASEMKDAAANKMAEAKDAVSSKMEEVKNAASEAKDAAADKAVEMKDAAANKMAEAKDAMSSKMEAVKNSASETKDAAADKAAEAKDAAANKAAEVKEAVTK